MRRRVSLFLLTPVVLMAVKAKVDAGPYDPAAGQPGSLAVHMFDPAFVGWASGWLDYQPGANVSITWQTPDKALGPAVGNSFDVVSLGEGGSIVLTFDRPIFDGPGWDFAVFENSFSDTFLELAYVEVSSDGVNYFRFPNDSLTPGPVGPYGAVDPTNITGLAGKYRQGWGTPFDLAVLVGISPLLDFSNIQFVRILDIIGDGTYRDTSGDPIYDPYPTTGSAGFDLDAVGVRYFAPEAHIVPEPSALAILLSAIPFIGVKLGRKFRNAKSAGVIQRTESVGDQVTLS